MGQSAISPKTGSKSLFERDLLGKSVPAFSDHARAITLKNRGSGGAPRPKKETRPTRPGASYIAAQYSQEMPKNNDKARAAAPNSAAFFAGLQGLEGFLVKSPNATR
jgi:hypothetical protein